MNLRPYISHGSAPPLGYVSKHPKPLFVCFFVCLSFIFLFIFKNINHNSSLGKIATYPPFKCIIPSIFLKGSIFETSVGYPLWKGMQTIGIKMKGMSLAVFSETLEGSLCPSGKLRWCCWFFLATLKLLQGMKV